MRTIAIVILSVVLAAAVVSGLILYQRYHDAQAALQLSEKRVAELSAKLGQVSEETATLRDQVTELEGARTRVSELEHAINQKDHAFSELNKAVHTLTRDLEKERKITEQVTSQLTTRNTMVTELEDHVQGLHSTIRSLKEEVARSQRELEELQKRFRDVQSRAHILEEQLAEKGQELERHDRTLLTLRGEKASAEASIDELRSTYESLIAGLKERIDKQEVTIERFEQEISVTFVDRILFEFGKVAITPEGRTILKKIGETLQTVKGKKLRVVGHTDDRPIRPDYRDKFPSNWELSSARASAVIHYFQEELGLDPTRLEAVGRSFYDPVATNQTPEGRARNRRVEIIIAPELE
jgi:chemotaxis protein MotB